MMLLLVTTWLVWIDHNPSSGGYLLSLNLAWFSLGALVTWLIVTLLLGRVYCSVACPMGVLQDVAAWVSKRVQYAGKGNYRFVPRNDWIRYFTLLFVMVSLVSDDSVLPMLVDPSQLHWLIVRLPKDSAFLYGLLGIIAAVVIVIAILVLAYRSGRTFCNTVCPIGTLLGTVSRVSLYHFEIDPDECVYCGVCEQECKALCINSEQHTIDASRCVMCANCAASCPVKAIKYTSTHKRLSTPLMQPTSQ